LNQKSKQDSRGRKNAQKAVQSLTIDHLIDINKALITKLTALSIDFGFDDKLLVKRFVNNQSNVWTLSFLSIMTEISEFITSTIASF